MSMPASLLYALIMLPMLLLRVFVGTYLSRNEKVRRAGLVADVNALALAVAVILLLTSRDTFNEAEDTIKHQAWANLLQDSPGAACASLNRQAFDGRISQGIHFKCIYADSGRWPRWSWPVNATNKGQTQAVLRALSACNASSMGMHYVYHDVSVWYAAADTHHSVGSIIDSTDLQSTLEFDQRLNSWASLDVITPEDSFNNVTRSAAGGACADKLNGTLADVLARKLQYNPAAPFGTSGFPGDLGFPPGMEIVRWLDRYGKGIYLGVNCNSTLLDPSPELQHCINSSTELADTRGPWTQEFDYHPKPADTASFQLRGEEEEGAFCPADGELRLFFFLPAPYRCSNGAQSGNVSLLNNEVSSLKGIRYFAYFRCLSYDELFGVYVGTVGVLMSVALATSALHVTDVARPLLLAGREAWSWDFVLQTEGATGPEVEQRHYEWAKTVFEVILRCVAGCVVGTAQGMCLIHLPWRSFLNDHAHTCTSA